MKSARHIAKASKITSALQYGRAGYLVMPLLPGSKVPALRNWPKAATSDEGQIRAWWSEEPDYNVGVATGRGLVVFDYDTTMVNLTGAFQVRTPRGTHVYWQASERVKSRPWIRDDYSTHVNVISEGDYVVGAGSIVGGKTYEPSRPIPTAHELPVFPSWLCDSAIAARRKAIQREGTSELDTPGAVERARTWLIRKAPEALDGARGYHPTFKVAGRCRDFGLSQAVTLEIMLADWNELKAVPPWSPEQLAKIVWGAYAPVPRQVCAAG